MLARGFRNLRWIHSSHSLQLLDLWQMLQKNAPGSIKADSVLVLAKNYGRGIRWSEYKIAGIFKANDQTQQLWELNQTTLENHGLKTDIICEDLEYPFIEEYQNINYRT